MSSLRLQGPRRRWERSRASGKAPLWVTIVASRGLVFCANLVMRSIFEIRAPDLLSSAGLWPGQIGTLGRLLVAVLGHKLALFTGCC